MTLIYHNIKKFKNVIFLLMIILIYPKQAVAHIYFENHFIGTDSVQYVNNDNDYNLVIACLRGDYNIVEDMLNKGISPNTVIDESITPLMYAAQSGQLRICKLLVAKGADVNLSPRNGHTALIAAVKSNNVQVLDFLMEKGALIDLPDIFGRTPIIYAAVYGDSALCEKLFLYKADVSIKDYEGEDALMAAVINQHKEIIPYLLSRNANPNTSNKNDVSPLMVATSNNDYTVIELLLNKGANINHISKGGQTPLSIAIEKNDEALLQYLIDKGADVNQRLTFAETPLTIAHYNKIDDFIIETLENDGAKQNYWPDLRRFFIGPEISWNLDDFMGGINLGLKEYKFKFDIIAGMQFRPYATRVLVKDAGNKYDQYWERRNYTFIGIDKNFEISKTGNKRSSGISIGLKELYTFGNYRGTSINTPGNYLLVPGAGIYQNIRGIQFGLYYQFTDFNTSGVQPHRIDISIKFLIGGVVEFKSNSYKPWD